MINSLCVRDDFDFAILFIFTKHIYKQIYIFKGNVYHSVNRKFSNRGNIKEEMSVFRHSLRIERKRNVRVLSMLRDKHSTTF